VPRPVVLGPVELGAAEPVLPGQLEGVLDPHPALLRAADEEQSTEAPEGLPAEALLALLVDQDHAAARVGRLGGRSQPGQPCPHDDDVGVHVCSFAAASVEATEDTAAHRTSPVGGAGVVAIRGGETGVQRRKDKENV
jgi:hypothetical protein